MKRKYEAGYVLDDFVAGNEDAVAKRDKSEYEGIDAMTDSEEANEKAKKRNKSKKKVKGAEVVPPNSPTTPTRTSARLASLRMKTSSPSSTPSRSPSPVLRGKYPKLTVPKVPFPKPKLAHIQNEQRLILQQQGYPTTPVRARFKSSDARMTLEELIGEESDDASARYCSAHSIWKSLQKHQRPNQTATATSNFSKASSTISTDTDDNITTPRRLRPAAVPARTSLQAKRNNAVEKTNNATEPSTPSPKALPRAPNPSPSTPHTPQSRMLTRRAARAAFDTDAPAAGNAAPFSAPAAIPRGAARAGAGAGTTNDKFLLDRIAEGGQRYGDLRLSFGLNDAVLGLSGAEAKSGNAVIASEGEDEVGEGGGGY